MSSEIDISDGICVYVVGGLGNQLFGLAAGWAQAERLGCPLYLDHSYHALPGANWTPQLGGIAHPGIDVTHCSPWRGIPLLAQKQGLFGAVKHGKQQLHLFTEAGFGYDPRINGVIPGTTIVGYFQSPRYFESIRDKLYRVLVATDLAPEEHGYLESINSERRASLHVRRGDYLAAQNNQIHGLAERSYFARAIRLYDRLHPGSRFRAYTDSRNDVAAEIATLAEVELAPPDEGLRPIAGMLAMAAGDGIIISNSSYSWWAGWLISERDPEATVIAPRPWFRSGESASDLLLPDWPALDARD
jgi:hypothetical protein